MKKSNLMAAGAIALFTGPLSGSLLASSHMDAPLITLDDPANTTDVYAFKTARQGNDYLVVALSVYPHEVPGVGPNAYRFDDDVRYSIHIGLGDDVAAGKTSQRYDFNFVTNYTNDMTILQSYLGVVGEVGGANQNLTQTYTVKRQAGQVGTELGSGTVPPNNQGIATPLYNQDNDGTKPEKQGVDLAADLDPYTAGAIAELSEGYRAFAGQREDGFYGDIQAIFDLLQLRSGGASNSFDSQAGFNVHTMVLEIPLAALGGSEQVVAVHASTSRPRVRLLSEGSQNSAPRKSNAMAQVGRQGNPLICEAVIPIAFKDIYNRTSPEEDVALFTGGAMAPELITLIDILVLGDDPNTPEDEGIPDDRRNNRSDLAGLLLPDTLKVDLSTPPARLTGATEDDGYSRLGIFGGDVLPSTQQAGFFNDNNVPGGWPNGRRFGDDVIDIAVYALVNDFRTSPPTIDTPADGIDNVSANDALYNKVFPYAGTPHNGRNYEANPLYVNPGLPEQP